MHAAAWTENPILEHPDRACIIPVHGRPDHHRRRDIVDQSTIRATLE